MQKIISIVIMRMNTITNANKLVKERDALRGRGKERQPDCECPQSLPNLRWRRIRCDHNLHSKEIYKLCPPVFTYLQGNSASRTFL